MLANPPDGDAVTAEAEDLQTFVLQAGATADGNGTPADAYGLAGTALLEIANTGTGATTVNVEGSFDTLTWYAAGYQQIDGIAAPARSTSGFASPAASHHVLQVLDRYPYLRARLSGSVATPALTATLRQFPQ